METIAPPSLTSMIRDFADMTRPATWRTTSPDQYVPRGDGHSVLFAPGAGGNDLIMASVRNFYRDLGYDAQGWKLGLNIGPLKHTVRGLENRLFELNDHSGQRVSLVGKSLGGMLMRELAKKYPQRVRRLILICAPIRHPMVSRLAPIFQALQPFIDPSFHDRPVELSRPAPVPTTALFTKWDGLLAWQCCLEEPGPFAENIELPGAYHTTAAMHPATLRIMAERLAIKDPSDLSAMQSESRP
jgi:pimeloyl-ACP methyl ester carboxylesterase